MISELSRPVAGEIGESPKVDLLKFSQIDQVVKLLVCELNRLGLLSRLQEQDERWIITGPLRIDVDSHEALVDDSAIALKPREFALLKVLAQNVGRVLSREQLLDLAWPDAERMNSNRTVDVHICRVRSKLGEASDLICTVDGFGYKLARLDRRTTLNR